MPRQAASDRGSRVERSPQRWVQAHRHFPPITTKKGDTARGSRPPDLTHRQGPRGVDTTPRAARRKLLHVAPRQRRQRQQTVPLGWGTDDLDDDPALVDPATRDDSPEAVDRRMARLLRVTLGKLEPDEQAAVLRRYGDGHTLAEVADELGTTETAANTLVRRALRELRRSLIGEPTAFAVRA